MSLIVLLITLADGLAGGLMGAWLYSRRRCRSMSASIRYAEHHCHTHGGTGACRH